MHGDVLRRRILPYEVDAARRHLLRTGTKGITFGEDHAVIEGRVYPALYRLLGLGEVDHHAALVKGLGLYVDLGKTVVTVQVAALSRRSPAGDGRSKTRLSW